MPTGRFGLDRSIPFSAPLSFLFSLCACPATAATPALTRTQQALLRKRKYPAGACHIRPTNFVLNEKVGDSTAIGTADPVEKYAQVHFAIKGTQIASPRCAGHRYLRIYRLLVGSCHFPYGGFLNCACLGL
jgi:hypothetical protein